jgi:hypothetical protein
VSVAPAWSAELVEVRVGNHPTFTRVVFEFDVATGYRVERHAEGEPENVIVVTLDAASRRRNIVSRSPGVASVSVEKGFDGAIARISARKPGLPIKEMILRDPPRVVLDLMLGESAPVVVPTESAPAPAVVEPEPEPERIAKPAPEPEVPAPEVPAVAPAPKPEIVAVERERAAVEPAPAPEPERAAVEPVPAPEPAVAETEFEPEVVAEPVIPPESVVDEVEEEVVEVEERLRVAEEERAPGAEGAPDFRRSPDQDVARRRPAEARLAAKEESREAPFDIRTAGAIAGGALALILVVFFVVRRRRALPNDMDVTALAAEGEGADEASDDGRIPKGGFSVEAPLDGEAHPAEDFELGDSGQPDDEDKPIDSIATGPDVAPGLYDEAPHEKEAMTMENQDLPITRMDSDAVTQPGAGAALVGLGEDSDIARIVQDLERRVAHLETRLDESIDARERLERQVAAQSEELRVQRAAIARTQRALRSLSRTEEEQATEPALRDPSKPTGSE